MGTFNLTITYPDNKETELLAALRWHFGQVEEAPPEIFRPDESSRDEVLRDLDAVRAERDGAAVRDALDAIEETARGAGNLMGPILEAVDRYATLGEVCGRLEDVFGSYSAPEVLG